MSLQSLFENLSGPNRHKTLTSRHIPVNIFRNTRLLAGVFFSLKELVRSRHGTHGNIVKESDLGRTSDSNYTLLRYGKVFPDNCWVRRKR